MTVCREGEREREEWRERGREGGKEGGRGGERKEVMQSACISCTDTTTSGPSFNKSTVSSVSQKHGYI